jgi:hypothetical protein
VTGCPKDAFWGKIQSLVFEYGHGLRSNWLIPKIGGGTLYKEIYDAAFIGISGLNCSVAGALSKRRDGGK